MLDNLPKDIIQFMANKLTLNEAVTLSSCCKTFFREKLNAGYFLTRKDNNSIEILLTKTSIRSINQYLKTTTHPGLEIEFSRSSRKIAALKYEMGFHLANCFKDILEFKQLASQFKLLVIHALVSGKSISDEEQSGQLKLIVSKELKLIFGDMVFTWLEKNTLDSPSKTFQEELLKIICHPDNVHTAATLEGLKQVDATIEFCSKGTSQRVDKSHWLEKVIALEKKYLNEEGLKNKNACNK